MSKKVNAGMIKGTNLHEVHVRNQVLNLLDDLGL